MSALWCSCLCTVLLWLCCTWLTGGSVAESLFVILIVVVVTVTVLRLMLGMVRLW